MYPQALVVVVVVIVVVVLVLGVLVLVKKKNGNMALICVCFCHHSPELYSLGSLVTLKRPAVYLSHEGLVLSRLYCQVVPHYAIAQICNLVVVVTIPRLVPRKKH